MRMNGKHSARAEHAANIHWMSAIGGGLNGAFSATLGTNQLTDQATLKRQEGGGNWKTAKSPPSPGHSSESHLMWVSC